MKLLELPLELQNIILNNVDLETYINFTNCSKKTYNISKCHAPFYIKEHYQHRLLKLTFESQEAFETHPLIKKLFIDEFTFCVDITDFEIEIESNFYKYDINLLLGPISLKIIDKNSRKILSSLSGNMINHELDGIVRYRSGSGGTICLFSCKRGLKQRYLYRSADYTDLVLYDHKGRKIKCYFYIDEVLISEDVLYDLLPCFKAGTTEQQFNLDIERILDGLIDNLKIEHTISYDYTANTYERQYLDTDGYYISDRQIKWTPTDNPEVYSYKYNEVCEERTSDIDAAIEEILYFIM